MAILLGYSILSFYDIAKNVWKSKLRPVMLAGLASIWDANKNNVESI